MTKQILIVAALLAGIMGTTVGMAADESPLNLAQGKPCKVFSSMEINGCSTAALTDGKRDGAGWCGKAFSAYADHRLYPEFIVVDLGQNYSLNRIELFPVADGSGFPEDFTLQACREGEPWKIIERKQGYPAPANGDAQVFNLPPCEGRYVKIEATRLRKVETYNYCFRLAEVEVYGIPREAEPFGAKAQDPQIQTRVTGLRCEHFVDPVGVDAEKPRLDWIMESSRRGERQTACRILVASDRTHLDAEQGDLWDSGKVEGDQSVAVRYGGQPLKSGQRCLWKVMIWDQAGQPIPWSEPARFITGKMKQEDWKGQWIGTPLRKAAAKSSTAPVTPPLKYPNGAIYLRKEFSIDKPVRRATAFFCGLGFSELYVDGIKAGEGRMTPGFTTYDKRVQYLTYDLSDRFAQPGRKALGAILVDGWYGLAKDPFTHRFEAQVYVDRPKMRLDLQIEFADGSEMSVSSDPTWKWSQGEITRSWICEEDIDLRDAQPGWNRPGFNDAAWVSAMVVQAPAGRMICQRESPTRVTAVQKPQTLATIDVEQKAQLLGNNDRFLKPQNRVLPVLDGKAYLYDFGREFTGTIRFRTAGPAGTRVTLTICTPAYHPDPDPTGCPGRVNSFILAGSGVEQYESRFCYNNISRVMVEGVASPPALDDLSGVELSGVAEPSGGFRCSNDLVNWLHESARQTQKAYVTYLPNDPTREYKAWMQDPQNMFQSACYLFDSRAMYERWQRDILDCQAANGTASVVAPGRRNSGGSPWWTGCLIWVPWHWFQQFGDPSLLGESYEGMKAYLDLVARVGVDKQIGGFGDWDSFEPTSRRMVNMPAYYLFARIVSQTADMLGRKEDAAKYGRFAETIRREFITPYLGPQAGATDGKVWSQTGAALALALGVVPAESRSELESCLLQNIAMRKYHIASGFVGTPYVLEVLADLSPETGYRMTTQQDFPSWYSLTAGADHNLMQEKWNGRPAVMPSLGGNIAGWDMQALGGIRPDPTGPGFKKILIKPAIVGDLHWVESWYDSVHGRIVSNWQKRGRQLLLAVHIPANTTATVYVPARSTDEVTESGQPASKAEGVKFLKMENGAAVYEVGSGVYQFLSQK